MPSRYDQWREKKRKLRRQILVRLAKAEAAVREIESLHATTIQQIKTVEDEIAKVEAVERFEALAKAFAQNSGSQRDNRKLVTGPPTVRGNRRRDRLTPGSKALAAAVDLHKAGKRVSLNSVCKLAKVDRANLRAKYPDAVMAINALASPERVPKRGTRDRRTGDIDAVDEPEE